MLYPEIRTRHDFVHNLVANGQIEQVVMAAKAARASATAEKKLSPEQAAIEACQEGVDALCEVFNAENDALLRDQLGEFAIWVASNTLGMSPDARDSFVQAILEDFNELCVLAKNDKLPKDARKQVIKNLVDDLAICAPGIVQNINAAVSELKVLTYGVGQHFANELIKFIDNHNVDFMPTKKVAANNKDAIEKKLGNEKHYGAALFNQVAKHFNLPPRTDVFVANNSVALELLTKTQREECEKSVLEKVTAEVVIHRMAEDFLQRVQAFYVKNSAQESKAPFDSIELGERWLRFEKKLAPKLKPIFGLIDKEVLFPACAGEDDRYRLTQDITLIARCITRNLRAAGVLEPFKATYILGEKNPDPEKDPHTEPRLKLKKLGHLVYVSETSLNIKETTQKEKILHEGKLIDQVKLIQERKLVHHHQLLDQFIWHDTDRGKKLLDALAAKEQDAALDAKKIHDEFFENMPASLLREMQAASSLENVDALFEQAMSLLESEEDKKTAALQILHQAALARQRSLVDHLFKKLRPEQVTLSLALQYQQTAVARDFIRQMTPEQLIPSNNNDDTVLMSALHNKHSDIVFDLVDKMTEEQLFMKNGNGDTWLHSFVKYLFEIIEQLFEKIKQKIVDPEKIKILLNTENDYGFNPLKLAFVYKYRNCAQFLINELSVEQLCMKGKYGNTPLHTALTFFPEMAEPLIEKLQKLIKDPKELHRQLNMQNDAGNTPLMFALKNAQQHRCAMLLIDMLDPEELNVATEANGNNTALMYALKFDIVAATALIHKLDIKQLMQPVANNITPLMATLAAHQPQLTLAIFQKMIDALDKKQIAQHLAHRYMDGDNALIFAIKCGEDASAANFIPLMNQQDLGFQDADDNTALMVALLDGNIDIASALSSNMTSDQLRIKNKLGQTARDIAKFNGY